MSANLIEGVVLNALTTAFEVPLFSQIGDIQVDTTLEELYEDAVEVTEHPVEAGAQISDHAFKKPMELVLVCGWSESSISGLTQFGADSFGGAQLGSGGPINPGVLTIGSFLGGAMNASSYVAGIYSQLLQLQEALEPISVSCGLRSYENMMLTALRVRRDERTRYTLALTAFFRQVIITSTQVANVPPAANQAVPASTAGMDGLVGGRR